MTCLLSASCRVAFAALIHDLGKFARLPLAHQCEAMAFGKIRYARGNHFYNVAPGLKRL